MSGNSSIDRIRNWYNRHFLGMELLISVAITAVIYILFHRIGINQEIPAILKGIRLSLYTVIAGISGSLLGFTLTGVSVLLAFSTSDKLSLLKQSPHYKTVYLVYISTIKFLAMLTVVALLSIFLDRDNSPRIWVFYLSLWSVAISGLRLFRCVWVLKNVIAIAVKDG